jgi:hypothetical protein
MSTATITLAAKKKKTGEPYDLPVGAHHYVVLNTLRDMPDLSDHEVTFLNDIHMLAARRCELRDAGMVEQSGRNNFGMTWRLTDAGLKFVGGAA